jgi:hypothetical protein
MVEAGELTLKSAREDGKLVFSKATGTLQVSQDPTYRGT